MAAMNVELQKFSACFAQPCDLCFRFLELQRRGDAKPAEKTPRAQGLYIEI